MPENFFYFTAVQYCLRFGEDAGELTDEVMTSVGNVALTTHNLSHLGVKAIVKQSAKDASRAVAEDRVATSSNDLSI